MKSAPRVNLHLVRGSGEAGEAHNSVSPTSKVGPTNKNKLELLTHLTEDRGAFTETHHRVDEENTGLFASPLNSRTKLLQFPVGREK